MGLNCRKDDKTPPLSIKTQQRADMTRSRWDNKFSSHACGNTKPELVRSRRRLGGVGDMPVEGPISFNGGRERRFLVEQEVDVCFLLCSGRLVHVIFV